MRCAPRLVSGRSAILRLMSAQGRLEIRAAWGLSERYLARAGEEGRYSMEAERVLAARRPLVIDDLATRPDLPLQSTLLEEGLRTAIAVPIARPDRPLGVLTVHAEAAHAFAGQDLSLLTVLAEQTAIAIDHARLFREAETRQARLAEQAREMEAFAYTVSHDLKTPLRAMDGYARALIEDYGGQLDAAGVRYLTSIAAAASRMGELIDDLLRYSRIERREMRSETVAFEPLLDRICGDLAGEMRAKGLTVRRELAVGSVEGDTEGLRMALANLVGNAVKFSPPAGGTITVGTRVEGESVLLWVTDTGIGFDMRYAERIFRIFERLNRDDEYPGTGIGLAIVRKVAERHGGRAWATSEPGVGSTFQVALPLSRGGPP